jgi:hypothetical protein
VPEQEVRAIFEILKKRRRVRVKDFIWYAIDREDLSETFRIWG